MTSINLQFMLFLKPLSVHSRSILWRPGERERERGDKRKQSHYISVYFRSFRCLSVRLIVL